MGVINKSLYTSNKDNWRTPPALFEILNNEFHFTLDPSSDDKNALCEKHFTKEQDGLIQSWENERVYCNPPYGKEIPKWLEKIDKEVNGGGVPFSCNANSM